MNREYPDRPFVGVGGIVIQGQQVLLVRRGKPPRQGEWSIPGGMLELGEKLRDGVAREVEEETGITVTPLEVLDVFDSITPDADGKILYHYALIDFLCSVVGGELRAATDVSDARWATLDEALTLVARQMTKDVIRKGFSQTTARLAGA